VRPSQNRRQAPRGRRNKDLATECDEVVDIAPFVAERADESTSSRMLIRTGSVTSRHMSSNSAWRIDDGELSHDLCVAPGERVSHDVGGGRFVLDLEVEAK
jgi:hypothetical protein